MVLIIFTILIIIMIISIVKLYFNMTKMNFFVYELSNLVTRTFREYYKGENMEPVVTGRGIEILWKEDGEDCFSEDGFISIYVDGTSNNIKSPIKDHKDADIIAGKIINIINDYVVEKQ